MKLFIVDKPSVAKTILNDLRLSDILVVANNPHLYQFDYDEFKFLSKPLYKPKKMTYDEFYLFKSEQQKITELKFYPYSEVDYSELFNELTEIHVAVDDSYGSIRATDCFFNFMFKSGWSHLPITFSMVNYEINRCSQYFSGRINYQSSEVVQTHRCIYQLKDHIDYNFNGMIKTQYPDYEYMTRNMIKVLCSIVEYGNNSIDAKKINEIMKEDFFFPRSSFPMSSMAQGKMIDTLQAEAILSPQYQMTDKGWNFFDQLSVALKNKNTYQYLHSIQQDFEKNTLFFDIHENNMHVTKRIKGVDAFLADLFKEFS